MSKTDTKSRGTPKKGGLLSSFFGSGRDEMEGPDGLKNRADGDRADGDHADGDHPGAGYDQDGMHDRDFDDERGRDSDAQAEYGPYYGASERDLDHDFDEDGEAVKTAEKATLHAADEGDDGDDDGVTVIEPEIELEPVAGTVSSDGSDAREVTLREESGGALVADTEVYTTGFSDVANARLWRRQKEARDKANERQRTFRNVFTPTRPKRKTEEFLGRREVISSVIEAIEEECAHVVLCGEAGLGKTSLANVITTFAGDSGYLVARMTGTEDMTFGRMIRTLFEELFQQIDNTPSGRVLWEKLGIQDLNELLQDNAMDVVSEFLGEESLDVTRVIRALDKLSDNQAIFIIDDYDQIKSRELKVRLVQVMKALSDQGGWLSFLIMGRGESPSELLQDDIEGLHNAVGVYLDPLPPEEVEEVILDGAQRTDLTFNQDTIQAIARLSQGVPNVVQWLCFLAARRAIRRKGATVEIEDLANIVSDAVTKIDARLRNQYDQASKYEKGNNNADLLYLAVRSPSTPSGLFSAATMNVLSKQIIGRKWKESEIHTALLPLCGKGDKSILRKLETSEGTFYRFAHPTMRAVVMLKKIVRIPLLSDMRTRDVDQAYLPLQDEARNSGAILAAPKADRRGKSDRDTSREEDLAEDFDRDGDDDEVFRAAAEEADADAVAQAKPKERVRVRKAATSRRSSAQTDPDDTKAPQEGRAKDRDDVIAVGPATGTAASVDSDLDDDDDDDLIDEYALAADMVPPSRVSRARSADKDKADADTAGSDKDRASGRAGAADEDDEAADYDDADDESDDGTILEAGYENGSGPSVDAEDEDDEDEDQTRAKAYGEDPESADSSGPDYTDEDDTEDVSLSLPADPPTSEDADAVANAQSNGQSNGQSHGQSGDQSPSGRSGPKSTPKTHKMRRGRGPRKPGSRPD